MHHHNSQPSYRVYILRSWFESGGSPGEPPVRRYSLEDPQTRQRRGFADLAALMSFLEAEAKADPRQDLARAGPPSGAETAGCDPL